VLDRPVLLVDIDGVISLFGFDPARPPAGRFLLVDGIGHLLSERSGEHLRALQRCFELVWCSGWEEKANDYLPAALGLPGPLPYLTFDRNPGRANTHWKLDAIDAFVAPQRPAAWIDDAHDATCERWAAGRPGPTLLVASDPAVGIAEAHVERLTTWAASVGEAAMPPRAAAEALEPGANLP
jgi:hypothetical protein